MADNVPVHVVIKDTIMFGAGHREEDGIIVMRPVMVHLLPQVFMHLILWTKMYLVS